MVPSAMAFSIQDHLVEHLLQCCRGVEAENAFGLLHRGNSFVHVELEGRIADQVHGDVVSLIFRQMIWASCRTVVLWAVERLKSSLRASGCCIASMIPRARSPPYV